MSWLWPDRTPVECAGMQPEWETVSQHTTPPHHTPPLILNSLACTLCMEAGLVAPKEELAEVLGPAWDGGPNLQQRVQAPVWVSGELPAASGRVF